MRPLQIRSRRRLWSGARHPEARIQGPDPDHGGQQKQNETGNERPLRKASRVILVCPDDLPVNDSHEDDLQCHEDGAVPCQLLA
jgi:hypothetical protein